MVNLILKQEWNSVLSGETGPATWKMATGFPDSGYKWTVED
jgi:hypothetical protein